MIPSIDTVAISKLACVEVYQSKRCSIPYAVVASTRVTGGTRRPHVQHVHLLHSGSLGSFFLSSRGSRVPCLDTVYLSLAGVAAGQKAIQREN